MNHTLSKAEWEALPAALKAFFAVDGENYKLIVSAEDDPGALRRARDREKAEAKKAKERAEALEAELDALKTDPARKAGDIKTLEDSWKKKLDDANTASTTRISALRGHIEKSMLDSAATGVTSKIAAKPEYGFMLDPHVRMRLAVEWNGDEPTIRVKDGQGKPSALSVDDLGKEFVATPHFSSVVAGSKASGAGGNGGGRSSNGGAGGAGTKKFGELSDAERTQMFRDDPDEFKKQSAEHQATLRTVA